MSQLEDLLRQCTVKLTLPGGWGTGFFVAPGLILTCAHVVQEAKGEPVQVRWQKQENWAEAVVERSLTEPYDLALLRVMLPADANPPCVYLDVAIQSRDPLYLFGYPDRDFPNGCPVTFNCEGLTGDEPGLIKFALGQVRPGMSGAPLLHQRTGKVCGIVKFTRDRSFDLGGGAVPTRVILEQFPQLREFQQEFHECDRRWIDLVAKPSNIDFQPYLNAIASTYEKWWQLYTLTDAEGKQRQSQEVTPIFDFGLMVQTVKKEEREQRQKEKVERFSVLEGLRKYAEQQVLLIGRPGSGKSTALARLMLEEATTALTPNPSPNPGRGELRRIPVLVELRYWQSSIAQLILNSLTRHGLALTAKQLETVLPQLLILFDGVNELPSEEARSQLSAFRRNHPKVPMIFTTRDLSLGGDLGIEKKLEMQTLTETQMQAFIRAYVPEQAEEMLRQLRDRLREFGQTPLLLWMLCEVFQQTTDNQLPSNLAGVFQVFTNTYEISSVRKHEVALLKGDVRSLSDRRLWKKALKALASLMMQGETPVDFRRVIHRDEAERELSKIFPTEQFPVRDILDDLLKYHLLQNRSLDQIEFRHQLIQEYYAAEYLLRILPNLSDEQLKRDYLNYVKWTEPIALMLALVDEEAQALRVVKLAMDDVDLMLGARLAGEVQPAFQTTTIDWIDALQIPPILKCKCWAASQSEVTIPKLLEALENQNYEVSSIAARALGRLGDETAIPELLTILEYDVETRGRAASLLGELGSETAIPHLFKLLEHQDSDVREKAADVFGQLSSEAAIPGLLEALESQDRGVRWRVAEALGILGNEAAIPGLLKALNHQKCDVRWNAASALGKLGNKAAVSGLLKALEDQDPFVRKSAAESLGMLGSLEAIPELLKALEEPKEKNIFANVAGAAAIALGDIGSTDAIPGLLKLLEHQDSDVREHATSALESLIDKVKNYNAAYEKANLDNKDVFHKLLKALQDQNSNVRRMAASTLEKLGCKDAIPGLLKALRDPKFDVRWNAANALGKLGDTSVVPELLKSLKDRSEDVRSSGAEALGSLGSQNAIPELLKLLKDRDYSVRLSAIEALWKLDMDRKKQELIPRLLKKLETTEGNYPHDVRGQTTQVLGSLSSVDAMPGLLKACKDKDYDVCRDATEGLKKLGSPLALASLWHLRLKELSPEDWELGDTISTIQNLCKFYNYEIWQEAIQNGKLEIKNGEREAAVGQTTTVFNIETLNAPNAALNLGGIIHGDQSGTQSHPPKS